MTGGVRRTTAVLAGLVFGGVVVRSYLAYRFDGFQTGDDLEILQIALHDAVGLPYEPWDIRSLLIPNIVVAPLLELAVLFGNRDPFFLSQLARYPFLIASAGNVVLLYLLGLRWYGNPTAIVAAALYAVHWIPLVYGSSLYPRTFAVSCVLGAAILLESRKWLPFAAGGLLVALAMTTRWVALPLILLSAIFHKELRYLQVVIPFVALLAARGFSLWRASPQRAGIALLLLVLAFPLSLTRIRTVARRSTNAVAAARWIATEKPSVVALSQPWAYGGRVFLGGSVPILDLGVPPTRAALRHAARDATAVAIYSSDVDAGVATAMRDGGILHQRVFRGRGGRAVTVFHRW